MNCLRPAQVLADWVGDNSLVDSGFMSKVFMNKVNSAFSSEYDTRLQMYYSELYKQKIHMNKQTKIISGSNLTNVSNVSGATSVSGATNVSWVQPPKEHVPYQPTLLPTPPVSPLPPQLDDTATLKDIPHSAKAPRVGRPDAFLLGP